MIEDGWSPRISAKKIGIKDKEYAVLKKSYKILADCIEKYNNRVRSSSFSYRIYDEKKTVKEFPKDHPYTLKHCKKQEKNVIVEADPVASLKQQEEPVFLPIGLR